MVAVQKEGMAPLQGTDKMLLAVHNKKNEAQRRLWARQIEKEHHLSGMGPATFGTIEEI